VTAQQQRVNELIEALEFNERRFEQRSLPGGRVELATVDERADIKAIIALDGSDVMTWADGTKSTTTEGTR
jgi:hypothetical protein